MPETARFMSKQLPHAQLVRLEPAGHMAVFERHERLVSELASFADGVLTASRQVAPAPQPELRAGAGSAGYWSGSARGAGSWTGVPGW